MRARGDRITSLAAMARQERALARVTHAALREYLAVVAKAVTSHTAIRAASAPQIAAKRRLRSS